LIPLANPKQLIPAQFSLLFSQPINMANQGVSDEYAGVSKLAKYPFEPYWPEKQLRVCVTGAGGFIASHLAKRLKSEGHYVIACDWKRNEHFSVSL
jgi:GDP-D-mannose 3',5'-epimerase